MFIPTSLFIIFSKNISLLAYSGLLLCYLGTIDISTSTYLPCLVKVVCERPPTLQTFFASTFTCQAEKRKIFKSGASRSQTRAAAAARWRLCSNGTINRILINSRARLCKKMLPTNYIWLVYHANKV